MGRPITYSREVSDLVLERMADGVSLRQVCANDKALPGESTIRGWAVQDIDGFAARYARAREAQMEALAEDIIEISDDSSRDIQKDDEGREIVDHEHIQRAKLRVDTRKWLMARLSPKRYGDKVTQEHTGPDGSPITFQTVYEGRK